MADLVLFVSEPTLEPDVAWRGHVSREIALTCQTAGLTLTVCPEWDGFVTASRTATLALLVMGRLATDQPSVQELLRAENDLPCPLILLTDSDVENLRHLGAVRVSQVILHSEISLLPGILNGLARNGQRLRLRKRIALSDFHLTLKRALLWLVDQPVPEGRVARGDPASIPHSIEELAARRGISAVHLRKLAWKHGVRLGRFVSSHLALRALELLGQRLAPQEAAGRLRYATAEGMHRLIQRSFGKRASALLEAGLEERYGEVEALLGPNSTYIPS